MTPRIPDPDEGPFASEEATDRARVADLRDTFRTLAGDDSSPRPTPDQIEALVDRVDAWSDAMPWTGNIDRETEAKDLLYELVALVWPVRDDGGLSAELATARAALKDHEENCVPTERDLLAYMERLDVARAVTRRLLDGWNPVLTTKDAHGNPMRARFWRLRRTRMTEPMSQAERAWLSTCTEEPEQ